MNEAHSLWNLLPPDLVVLLVCAVVIWLIDPKGPRQ
jgi:hypothetical protein